MRAFRALILVSALVSGCGDSVTDTSAPVPGAEVTAGDVGVDVASGDAPADQGPLGDLSPEVLDAGETGDTAIDIMDALPDIGDAVKDAEVDLPDVSVEDVVEPDAMVVIPPTACAQPSDCQAAIVAAGAYLGCVSANCVAGACVFNPGARVGLGCNDADICTEGDVCSADGRCAGQAVAACACDDDGDCNDEAVGDLCTSRYRCASGTCAPDPAFRLVCFVGSDSFCGVTSCQAATGKCARDVLNVGLACSVDDVCVVDSVCAGGFCGGVPKACGDGEDCTFDSCDPLSGDCRHTPLSGVACDDGDACTTVDTCAQGSCVGGEPAPCDDAIACTVDACDSQTGACIHDTGGCVCATSADCNDGKVCTVDECIAGACVHSADLGAACDDGKGCTVEDTCGVTGFCGGAPKVCDDGVGCTVDFCNAANGSCLIDASACECVTDFACDDGDQCTLDRCNTGTFACEHVVAVGAFCDDGSLCTGQDACQADGSCAGGVVDCGDGIACTLDLCDPATGCYPDYVDCPGCSDDGDCSAIEPDNLCIDTWVCDKSQLPFTCVPAAGAAVDCSGNATACSHDVCDTDSGLCVSVEEPATTPCGVDADPCTLQGFCAAGGLCNVPVLVCDDDDACTGDVCAAGACQHLALAGETLFVAESFGAGMPEGWTVTSTNPVVSWHVDPGTDVVGGEGGALTVAGPDGTYDYGGGATVLTLPPVWIHGQRVTLRFWADFVFAEAPVFEACFGSKDYLSVRVAVNGGGAQPVFCRAVPADGWSAYEVDLSAFRDRQVAVSLVFNANTEANAAAGVRLDDLRLEADNLCDDGLPCTLARCGAGGCVAGVVCDDANPCTIDGCAGATGACVFDPAVGLGCDDGNACTDDETCQSNGVCGAGVAVVCDDDESCTDDACVDGSCVFTPTTGAGCDDGDACTDQDECEAGECQGTAHDCDDGNVCTLDGCVAVAGEAVCSYTQISGVACDDGAVCTTDDQCLNGVCLGLSVECTCMADADCANHEPNNQCVGSWVCNAGECKPEPGSVVTCAASGNPCMPFRCNPTSGACDAVLADFGAACDDGDGCTLSDSCFGGLCVGGPSCDDGNPCTEGFCVSGACQQASVDDPGPPFVASFDGGLPASWSKTGSSPLVTWLATPAYDENGVGFGMLASGANGYDHGASSTVLESPVFVPRGASVQLTFWVWVDLAEQTGFFQQCVADGTNDFFRVSVVTPSGEAVGVWCSSNDTGGWVRPEVDLSAWSDVPVRLRFELFANATVNGPGFGAAIDEVEVMASTPCGGLTECGAFQCVAGACVQSATACDDEDPCTADSCDPVLGVCFNAPLDPCEVCQADVECTTGDACVVGFCDDGICIEAPVTHGVLVASQEFATTPQGELPVGWTKTTTDALWTWKVDGSEQLGLTNPGAGTYPAAAAAVTSEAFLVPVTGADLSYALDLLVGDDSCTTDRLTFAIDGVAQPALEECAATAGWVERLVDLTPWAGQSVTLSWEVAIGAGAAGDLAVALDKVRLRTNHLCDDGDACTALDRCTEGSCGGFPICK